MRFLLRVDSHARNHSAHPQAQSQVAALRAYPAARSARAFQRRAPRVLCGSATASSAAPAGISSEFTASYLRLRSSLSCLIVRPCSHVRRSYLGYRRHILQVCPPTCPGPAQSRQCRSALAGSVDACAAEQSRRTLATGGNDLRRQHSNGCVDLLAPRYLAGALRACV